MALSKWRYIIIFINSNSLVHVGSVHLQNVLLQYILLYVYYISTYVYDGFNPWCPLSSQVTAQLPGLRAPAQFSENRDLLLETSLRT